MRHSGRANCHAARGVRPAAGLKRPGDDINLFPEMVGDNFVPARTRFEAQKTSCHALVLAALTIRSKTPGPWPGPGATAGRPDRSIAAEQFKQATEAKAFLKSLPIQTEQPMPSLF